MINPLLVFANAYDCTPAIEGLKEIPADQYHVNYFKYPENYYEIERFFEDHKEYTHLFYVAPDLVLHKEGWDIMIKYLKENDPDVYGGCCNVDTEKYKNHLACCLRLPTIAYLSRNYRWVSEDQRRYFLEHKVNVIEVKFNANVAFVKREVKDKIKYMEVPYPTDERPINEKRGGYACDLAFCHSLEYNQITPLVDMRVKFDHLRYWDGGKLIDNEPTTTFIKYKKK